MLTGRTLGFSVGEWDLVKKQAREACLNIVLKGIPFFPLTFLILTVDFYREVPDLGIIASARALRLSPVVRVYTLEFIGL